MSNHLLAVFHFMVTLELVTASLMSSSAILSHVQFNSEEKKQHDEKGQIK